MAIPRWGGTRRSSGCSGAVHVLRAGVMSPACICSYQECAVGYHTLGDMCRRWPVSWWEAGKVTVERYRP